MSAKKLVFRLIRKKTLDQDLPTEGFEIELNSYKLDLVHVLHLTYHFGDGLLGITE